jgi:hypothetical protein
VHQAHGAIRAIRALPMIEIRRHDDTFSTVSVTEDLDIQPTRSSPRRFFWRSR